MMPENEVNEQHEGQVQEAGATAPAETKSETKMEKFERERLSRRQALKKMGLTTGMAVFAMFSVDDLARMVGKAMQQRVQDNQVAEQVAREFQQAGIAMAGGPSWAGCGHCGVCVPGPYQTCNNCILWCSGQYAVDEPCSSQSSTADCNACCNYRNPGDANVGDAQACQLYSQCGSIDMNKGS